MGTWGNTVNNWERFSDDELERLDNVIRKSVAPMQTCDVCDKTMPMIAFAEGSTMCVYCLIEKSNIVSMKWMAR